MKIKSKILIIAGSDSSGGAGVQADIKTATSLGIYSMTAVTAVTVQNTKSVKSVIPIPANEIYNQIIYCMLDYYNTEQPQAGSVEQTLTCRTCLEVVHSL